MISLVTGGAGFIGVNLIRRLLADGGRVVAADNFVRGRRDALAGQLYSSRLRLVEADLSRPEDCERAFNLAADWGPIDEVWHLAANSDIPAGAADPNIDLRDTFLTTFHVVAQARRAGAAKFLFASSSAIYGDLDDMLLTEDTGPLLPISNYGAMKLASEGVISAARDFLSQGLIFRFSNVIGVPATHGVILDFIRRLNLDKSTLNVLGNGDQRKPYLHVTELIDAMMTARAVAGEGISTYNLGPNDAGVTVRRIAERALARVNPRAVAVFGSTPGGWVGDVPRFRFSTARINALGWRAVLSSDEALSRAIDEIIQQEGG